VKRKGQAGQAFILVLILLAIGAIMIIPVLDLGRISLKSSQTVTRQSKELYAADAAQEYVMWKLLYTPYPLELSQLGVDQPDEFSVDVCGTSVNVTVVLRAVASWRGVILIGDTPIKPTKTVSGPVSGIYTYTIELEQIGSDSSMGLDAVYDILPADFAAGDYQSGSSLLSVDNGPWQDVIGNPLIESFGGVERLRWPASGSFASPIREFTGGQVKKIQFKMASTSLKNNRTYYNWVVLKPWKALSGATAKIVTGTGATPQGGLINVTKSAIPPFVAPGVPTNITYTIRVTNQQGSVDQIQVIDDYLPPGFEYIGPTSGMTTIDPVRTYGPVNDVDRWKLEWTKAQFPGGNDISIASGATMTLTFLAMTSEIVSGSYYNELTVQMKNPVPAEFSSLGLTYADFNSGYTWNSAPVIVPAYDSSATAGDTTTDANLGVTGDSVVIYSYQVR